jgi:DtxR family manganese transport transcriptional regulator
MPKKTDIRSAAQRHNRVRRQHSDELAEDYVEAIYNILKEEPQVRISDLQAVFGVSHVTVIKALKRFEEHGYLIYSKSEGIHLTPKGQETAIKSAHRHALLVEFLVKLGVSPNQADADAEGAEHHLSEETYQAIKAFLES